MPTILPLPTHTAHLLSSAQLLLTPSSAVKELVDNALDAGASSIAIEVSANTLDIIQVRDNGHGIPPDDRALFGRRGCTSKIRDEEDLKRVGGKTLGFRGEAVSALAGGPGVHGVCGGLRVVTRVAGEEVGCAWNVGVWDGKNSDGLERLSHPIGTTVRASEFFARVPVRRQEALTNAAKCLAAVKRLLQGYALARPLVRFSLKVLKAKSGKGNWMFAPCKKPASNTDKSLMEEAVAKCLGRELTQQCRFRTLEKGGYEVHAFLPESDADSTKINGFGQFLQIDGRPVASSKGLMKKIVKLWRDAIASAGLGAVKDGFLWLDLRCPEGSYDANVEPAKDDVMFGDERVVVGVVNEMMRVAYPLKEIPRVPDQHIVTTHGGPAESSTSYTGRITRSRSRQMETQVEVEESTETTVLPGALGQRNPLQITQKVVEHPFSDNKVDEEAPIQVDSTPYRQTAWRSNMYGGASDDEEDERVLPPEGSPEADFDELESETEEQLRSIEVSNPWVMAKLVAKPQSKQTAPAPQFPTRVSTRKKGDRNVGIGRYLVRKTPGEATVPMLNGRNTPQRSSSPSMSRTTEQSDSRRAAQAYAPFQSQLPSPAAATPGTNTGTPLSAVPYASTRARRQPPANSKPQSALQIFHQLNSNESNDFDDLEHTPQPPRKKQTPYQNKFKPPAFTGRSNNNAQTSKRIPQSSAPPPFQTAPKNRNETSAAEITRYLAAQPTNARPSPQVEEVYDDHPSMDLDTDARWTPINAPAPTRTRTRTRTRKRTEIEDDNSPLPALSGVQHLVLQVQASVRGIRQSLSGLDPDVNRVEWEQEPVEAYVGVEGWVSGEVDREELVQKVLVMVRGSGGEIGEDGGIRMGGVGAGREASEEMLF